MQHLLILRNPGLYNGKFYKCCIINHLSIFLTLCKINVLFQDQEDQNLQRMAHILSHCQCRNKMHVFLTLGDFYLKSNIVFLELFLSIYYHYPWLFIIFIIIANYCLIPYLLILYFILVVCVYFISKKFVLDNKCLVKFFICKYILY